MDFIELNNVEYGECIVMAGRQSNMLMVDCGSINQKLRETEMSLDDRFVQIADRYSTYMDRYFLLTHYHRDHMNGFKKILDAYPGFFGRVWIPVSPTDAAGYPAALDFALFAYMFMPYQSDTSQVNTSCVKIFQTISNTLGSERIFTLKSGDTFTFDNTEYEVLWPIEENYPFDSELLNATEQLNILFSSPFLRADEKKFMELKAQFLPLYVRCCRAFSVSGREAPDKRRSFISRLLGLLAELDKLKETLQKSPRAYDVTEIINHPLVAGVYSDTANSASVVFQNIRKKGPGPQDILMTGDCTPETIAAISHRLYDGYHILKAPHHGTLSGYSPLFSDMAFSHILISNGEYHAGGAIAQEYIDMQDTVRHCTGNAACKWFAAAGGCCNRLCICYDKEHEAGLTIKCPATTHASSAPGCRIVTAGCRDTQVCFCDSTPK